MPSFRRLNAVLITLLLGAAEASRATQTVVLSLEDFGRRALEASLRSRSIEESFESARYSYLLTRRGLTLPSLRLRASDTIREADDDAGTITDSRTRTGSLTVGQPLLTGADLSVSAELRDARTESEFNDVTNFISKTKYKPDFSAQVTQPLFLFVGNDSLRTWRRARIGYDVDQLTRRDRELDLMIDARALYYRLVLQIESLKVEQKKFESAEIVRRTTRSLVRAGKLPEVELIRTDIRANRDSRRIQNAKDTLEKSLNEARDFLQLPRDSQMRLVSPLAYEPFKITLPALIKEALEHNPSVRVSRHRVKLSEISLSETKEGNRPTVNSFLSYDLTKDRSNPLAPRDPNEWSAGVSMSWPIFDGTATNLRTRRAEISLAADRRSLDESERQIRLSVENTYIDLKRSEEQIKAFGLERESAQRNLRAMRLRYENGLTRLTDVFDAENEVRELELEYLGLLVSYNRTRDQLLSLVGRDVVAAKGTTK